MMYSNKKLYKEILIPQWRFDNYGLGYQRLNQAMVVQLALPDHGLVVTNPP